jgi:hypothetical protein
MDAKEARWADLNEFLARYTGEMRLALDALVACRAAAHAAWVANGSPTDGTRNRLQHALHDAVWEAEVDVKRAAERSGHVGAAPAWIVGEVRSLFFRAAHAEVVP